MAWQALSQEHRAVQTCAVVPGSYSRSHGRAGPEVLRMVMTAATHTSSATHTSRTAKRTGGTGAPPVGFPQHRAAAASLLSAPAAPAGGSGA